MKLVIPIKPKAQTRPKFSRHVGVYEDKKMKDWRRTCTYLVSSLYKGKLMHRPLKVDATFYLKAPESLSKKPTERTRPKRKQEYQDLIDEKIFVPKKPDLDNLEKALYDSISDSCKIWKDDNQIVEHTSRKIYSLDPRIEIEVKEI